MEDSLQRLRMDAPATNDNGGSSTRTPNGNRSVRDLSYHTVYGRSRKRHTDSVRKYEEDQRHGVRLESGLRAELLPPRVVLNIQLTCLYAHRERMLVVRILLDGHPSTSGLAPCSVRTVIVSPPPIN